MKKFVESTKQSTNQVVYFEEWTEVYTVVLRGVRHKVTWVYDSSEQERVSLAEAARRHVVDTQANTYHHRAAVPPRTLSLEAAVDDGLVGTEPAESQLTITRDSITYAVFWVWDPVRSQRCSPHRAVRRGLLDARTGRYTNYATGQSCSIHEAVYMGLVGANASDDLATEPRLDEYLTLETKSGDIVKITWVMVSAQISVCKGTRKPAKMTKMGASCMRW